MDLNAVNTAILVEKYKTKIITVSIIFSGPFLMAKNTIRAEYKCS